MRAARIALEQRDQLAGIPVRQRPEQRMLGDTRDRGDGADADGKRDDRDRGEAGTPAQAPECE